MSGAERIAALGAGRMGRGIAIVFAYAGHSVSLIDFKERPADAFAALAGEVEAEIIDTLTLLGEIGLFEAAADTIRQIAGRVTVVPKHEAASVLGKANIVFEGFPEVLDLKLDGLREASALCLPNAIIASTTSTILVDDLAPAVERPERFLNAHWLNPAFIVPLVEVSPGKATDPGVTERLKTLLEAVGKVPVICAASPGFIVPRIQGIAMNEAARIVEEGVASVEDVEKAAKYGFGFRFSVLGLLEFIDWGGGDILYHTSRYMSGALNNSRYEAPEIIERNMAEGRTGLKARQGFLDYKDRDVAAYRKARMTAMVERLRDLELVRAPRV
ncbi:3-hydroxybutyryl-CoA dehydrogenase [Tianweitania populi]|uniref:L-gulonate 3-dehydrogenase n=1 Tax=Tianweitania populi TaxID=1607949 RepID=A0A8J3GM10_9HYPH|nr:3-hydroxybutyryl-CoA dehydrogenase [Tianweitania populi]GHD20537.1 3-hydroxybutyryl-CoA dehydrogenase [Tianweitania populi]